MNVAKTPTPGQEPREAVWANIDETCTRGLAEEMSQLAPQAGSEGLLRSLPQNLIQADIPGLSARPEPVAAPVVENGEEPVPKIELPIRREVPKVGRNEPCPCGSGKKFKNCCGRTA